MSRDTEALLEDFRRKIFAEWVEFVERFIAKGTARSTREGSVAEHKYPEIQKLASRAWAAVRDITPPAWKIDNLFRAEDRLDLFGEFCREMKSHPNNVTLRAAGVSLYWFLSRFCPEYVEPGWEIDDDTGEHEETSKWVPDYSEEWEPYRREFQGYLSRLMVSQESLEVERRFGSFYATFPSIDC